MDGLPAVMNLCSIHQLFYQSPFSSSCVCVLCFVSLSSVTSACEIGVTDSNSKWNYIFIIIVLPLLDDAADDCLMQMLNV